MGLPETLYQLETPALVLDRRKLQANLDRMSLRMKELGVGLRPHIKTAKCLQVAEMATQGQPGGLTVSTLREAEYFAQGGFTDLIYAITMTPDKLEHVEAIQKKGAKVAILVDDPQAVEAIARKSKELGASFQVYVEIDSGYHRSGVDPESNLLLAVGKAVQASPNLSLKGVLTHAGHSYKAATLKRISEVAEEERLKTTQAAERLRAAGIPCPVVSVGSTPTAIMAHHLDGVTEARPGNYMFFDLTMCGLGVCRLEDIAVFVLTTVIARKPEYHHALVDAGALALSKDLSAHHGSLPGVGYGLAIDIEHRKPSHGLFVSDVCQEQGWLKRDCAPFPSESVTVGDRLAILPNHSCLTCAAYDRYWVVDGGTDIVDVWERTGGW